MKFAFHKNQSGDHIVYKIPWVLKMCVKIEKQFCRINLLVRAKYFCEFSKTNVKNPNYAIKKSVPKLEDGNLKDRKTRSKIV